jgi:hypothetical protein
VSSTDRPEKIIETYDAYGQTAPVAPYSTAAVTDYQPAAAVVWESTDIPSRYYGDWGEAIYVRSDVQGPIKSM